MKFPADFFTRYGYFLFTAMLALILGLVSWRLRTGWNPAADAAHAVSMPAAVSETASPVPEPSETPPPAWQRPVPGGVLTEFSYAVPAWNASMDCWQIHAGIDLAAEPGAPVCAAADGTVESVEDDPLLGRMVILNHADGWQSGYASLADTALQPGMRVRAGETVGTAGNSAEGESLLGCHLHFFLRCNGEPMKPRFFPR